MADPAFLFTGPVTIVGASTVEIDAIMTAVVRRELQPIQEQLMSQSSQIAAYTTAVTDLLSDVATKLDNLAEAIANPDDASNLSPQAQAELTSAMNRLAVFREAEQVGDENADGVPAPVEPAPVDEPAADAPTE